MDLVANIASQLGIDPKQASAVAGTVLGAVRSHLPAEEGQKLEAAVPEIGQWKAAAQEAPAPPAEGGGLLGGLLGAATSGIGAQILGAVAGEEAGRTAGVLASLGQLGVKPEQAAMVAPMVVDFLTERIGKEWTDKILAAAPMLGALMKR